MDTCYQKAQQQQPMQHRTKPRRWLISPGDEDEHTECNEFVTRSSLRVSDLKGEQETRLKHHLHYDEKQKRVREEEIKHITSVSSRQIGTSRYENHRSLESSSLESRINSNNNDEEFPSEIRTVTNNNFALHKSDSENQYHSATLYKSHFDTIRHQKCNSQRDHHDSSYQPLCNLKSTSLRQMMSQKRHQSYSITADLPQKLLIILIMNAIFNHLSQLIMHLDTTTDKQQHHQLQSLGYPTVISASALTTAALAAGESENIFAFDTHIQVILEWTRPISWILWHFTFIFVDLMFLTKQKFWSYTRV